MFLTACSAEKEQEKVQQSQNLSTEANLAIDSNIYAQATTANELEQCDLIADSTKKDECKDVVEANLLTIEAVKKMDPKLCAEIKLDRSKQNCELMVKNNLTQQQEAEKQTMILQDDNKLSHEMAATGKLKNCDKVQDPNFRNQCRLNIVMKEAIEEKDPSLCAKLEDAKLIESCKSSVK